MILFYFSVQNNHLTSQGQGGGDTMGDTKKGGRGGYQGGGGRGGGPQGGGPTLIRPTIITGAPWYPKDPSTVIVHPEAPRSDSGNPLKAQFVYNIYPPGSFVLLCILYKRTLGWDDLLAVRKAALSGRPSFVQTRAAHATVHSPILLRAVPGKVPRRVEVPWSQKLYQLLDLDFGVRVFQYPICGASACVHV